MIYTVTFNPSLDYIVSVDDFKEGFVNRTTKEKILPGGKGINVSIVLHNLEVDSIALGYIAGFTGQEIKRRVSEYGCDSEFIELEEGNSRINMKLYSTKESEVNGKGPEIQKEHIDQLLQRLDQSQDGDYVVLAGSIPTSIPKTIYMDILKRLEHKKVNVVVDATGELLKNVLMYHPFLIKPNHHELADLFQVEITSMEDIVYYAKELQKQGARNVLISMAKDGALLVTEDGEVFRCNAPTGTLVNSVGAGDSMVAGFIAGYMRTENYKEALRMGIATGSASAFSEELATKEEVETIIKKVEC